MRLQSDDMTTPMELGPYTPSSDTVEIQLNESDGVQEDTRYFYLIVATNVIGSAMSGETEFCK